jgi:hypothetical protein
LPTDERDHSLKTINKSIRLALPILICLLVAFVFLMLPKWLAQSPETSEWYALRLFPYLSWPLVSLTSLIPISITEIFVVAAVPVVPILLIGYIVRAVRSREKKRFFYRSTVVLSVMIMVVSVSFSLMHGIGYSRRPLHVSLELVPSERSAEELAEVMNWLAEGVAENRPVLPENDQGGMVPIGGIQSVLREGSEAMDMAAAVFPELSGNKVRVKPVALSHYWSYTGIVGMYFPFFGEANANVDVPPHTIPMTACHEISHIRGIAREQDANLAGFLACVSSDRPDFRYSGYMFALGYISGDLAAVDADAYAKIALLIPEGAYRDMNISYEYWKQFEGPVEEISTEVNDTYLKANLQPEGVHSYSLVSQLIIEYYFGYVKGAAD